MLFARNVSPWIYRTLSLPPTLGIWRRLASSSPASRFPPNIPKLETPEDNATAREWIATFKTSIAIPRNDVELSFSRSSGPGGQNVNKVNTKATLRLFKKSPWIPVWAKDALKKSPAYVSSSDSILLTSTVHRTQAENVQECLSKLHSVILSAAESCLVNEPSQEQRARVRRLEKAEKARRRLEKEKRSSVKRSRKSGWD
ncbi:RF-1 domain-containing protein [Cristinia sonorae]|uniref:RF-1 domain-containing protein n=1 Tax=Cristinia sonorae TaxID=1940300 RepID=A0A8K0XQ82_9AGAR|nr:RF-1 domain-containing protein [Cristinia sonorae]